MQTKQQPAYAPGVGASALSPVSAPPTTGSLPAGSPPTGMQLREVPIGADVYVALRDIARDTAGACWIDPEAPVWSAPDDIHVVRVSNAPEGLFVNLSTAYESLLASSPYEPAQHGDDGWRRATLSIS